MELTSPIQLLQGVHVTYDTPWARRDVLGIHPQKQVCLETSHVPAGVAGRPTYERAGLLPSPGKALPCSAALLLGHLLNRASSDGLLAVPDQNALPTARTERPMILICAQNGYFWVGCCVPTGRIVADDFFAFADIAEK